MGRGGGNHDLWHGEEVIMTCGQGEEIIMTCGHGRR